MTKREMIEAMLAGETLEYDDCTAWFDHNVEGNPFIIQYGNGRKEGMHLAWIWLWQIKREPAKRLMTIEEVVDFCVDTPLIVVRYNGREWMPPEDFSFSDDPINYEWTTADLHCHYGEPHRFEVDDTERS